MWGERLAFARTYGHGSARVYTRPLLASASVRSTRLPGVPARQCDRAPAPCFRIDDGVVPELELRGDTLAEIVQFGADRLGVCGAGQVWLVGVSSRRAEQVDHTTCGLSGSTFLGLSLTASRLLYARTCPGDPAGCRSRPALVYRYTPRTRRSEVAVQPRLLWGFTATGEDRALGVRSEIPFEDQRQPAELLALDPLRFAPER